MAETYLNPKVLKNFFEMALSKIGVEQGQRDLLIGGLIETSLRGVDSHGVRLMPHYVKAKLSGRINGSPKYDFRRTGPATVVMDADHGYGIPAATAGMDKAIEVAKETGIGAVAIKNSTHFGAAALYSLRAARLGMIGICATHAEAQVVPFNGKKPFLGTNPICFAAPCMEKEPFCLDMATSVIPRNKVLAYKEKGKSLEPGMAVDAKGNECLDPDKVAGLLPIGGYKGYGLGLVVEVLSSILTGMAYGPHVEKLYSDDISRRRKLGHFVMAMDISRFENQKTFKKRMQALMDELRALEPVDTAKPVMVANDPEKKAFAERLKTGIPVTDADLAGFAEIAALTGIKELKR